ncbi:MAG: phospholipid carrier-dependent glycosyltransferase [Pyrinomonadaceae bacterium]
MIERESVSSLEDSRSPDLVWLVSGFLIALTSIFIRFYWLDIKPLHHDEGVNGYFLTTLFRDGVYKYDPANYHGPTLYYISLAFTKLFGLTTLPVRWSVAIFGVLTVILALFLKRWIGRTGSLFAALFLALSPGMVFISRYFIHEIIFVFLSLAFVMSILYFIDRTKAGPFAIGWMALLLAAAFLPSTMILAGRLAGDNASLKLAFILGLLVVVAGLEFLVIRMLLLWNGGRPIYFILASGCVALLLATKETTFITLGTMLIACVCIRIWLRVHGKPYYAANDEICDENLSLRDFRVALGSRTDLLLICVAAGAAFIYILVAFFSSFFTYPEGLTGFLEAYQIWTRTGTDAHTQNGFWAYLNWGMKIEAPILIISLIGTIIAFVKARHRFAMFAGLWAVGLFLAYSIIPYKTPWLALSFLLPMCISAGYGLNELIRSNSPAAKFGGVLLGFAGAAVLAYQSYDLNFVRYDDESVPYVYAHTKREFLDLIREIEHYAEGSGKGKEAVIEIVSPDYWPMVWYLNDYKKANFHGRMAAIEGSEMIVAKKGDQDRKMIDSFSSDYRLVGTFALRPGVDLVLLVRKDLAGPDARELYKITEH